MSMDECGCLLDNTCNENHNKTGLPWSPTGKPVVPNNHTRLRQWGAVMIWRAKTKASSGHPPGSEIRRSEVRIPRKVSIRSYAFLHGQGRGLLRRRMKILLLQLPIQGHDFFFSNENIPLAGAYLKAVAARQDIDVELVPRPVMSYGSDQAILRFLVEARPVLVGMSCYQWNVERSLFLAGELKRELPSCTIVLGGPEITPDNDFLLRHGDFDVGVVGEGETAWESLLHSFPHIPKFPGLLLKGENGQWHFTGTNTSRVSLRHLPSPYRSGCLDLHVDKVLWLETVRGCVHRCAYCYYHKQAPRLGLFTQERILSEVHRARERGI